jgi:hypothetical protein
MTEEPLAYRVRKWALQRISTVTKRPDQHDRLAKTDWDVLVILDACRYDALQRVTSWPVERCRSPGSATGHWLEECERTGVLEGTHVATGNANYANWNVGAAEIEHVWKDHWNDRLGTSSLTQFSRLPMIFSTRATDPSSLIFYHLMRHMLPRSATRGFPPFPTWTSGDATLAAKMKTNFLHRSPWRQVKSTWSEPLPVIMPLSNQHGR